jgi:hypothetical protein
MSAIRPNKIAPKAEASSAVDATRPSSVGEIFHSLFTGAITTPMMNRS